MHSVTMAGLALAICLVAPGALNRSLAAPDNSTRSAETAPAKQRAVRPLKPSWEQCFDMSVNRGFNHDTEEWLQSIRDCMDGLIPL